MKTHKTSGTQEITADDFVLTQFSATTKMLYVGQVEEKVAFIYKMKVMWRSGESLQFAFSDRDNMSEIEREDIVVKDP